MSSRIDETGRVCADKTASRNLIENMLSFCVVITLFCQCVSLVHCQGYISLSAWIPAWCWEVGFVLFVRFDLPRGGNKNMKSKFANGNRTSHRTQLAALRLFFTSTIL